MRILYVTTIGSTMGFFKSIIKELLDDGHIVDIATNEDNSSIPNCYLDWGCAVYHISTSRSPLSSGNIQAIKQIKTIVAEIDYDIVHCHTPVAAMCTRIACRKVRKDGTKVFYTAHGFHFYKGAPKKNWLLYYPIEKICSYFTDVLITINQEDYALAKNKMKAKKVEYVPGVGIDLEKFGTSTVDRETKRKELGVPQDAILLLSVGELNQNKNHETIIRAIENLTNIYYVVAGEGSLKEHLQRVIDEHGMSGRVRLLGFRSDISELGVTADIFCFPSYREGLGMGAIEAMACGLPIVTSNVHGINDYSEQDVTGYKCAPGDIEGFKTAIENLAKDKNIRARMGHYNSELVKRYSVKTINELMTNLYGIKNKRKPQGEIMCQDLV